jgi:site-specific DNA recombinase
VRRQADQIAKTIEYKSSIAVSEGRPGWVLAETYEDNSKSAAKARTRDDFARMLADIRAGKGDVVMARHIDRLTRNLRDLVDLMEACQEHGVLIVTVEGDLDLNSPMGRMIVTILAAVAQAESERKGERQRSANHQRRQSGTPLLVGMRLCGYTKNYEELIEPEATLIAEAYRMLLAGVSQPLICAWLNEQGLRTSRGNLWQRYSVKQLLKNPIFGGLVLCDGELVPSQVPAVVDERTWRAAQGVLFDPAKRNGSGWGRPPKHLLTSLARCGVCDSNLVSHRLKGAGGVMHPAYMCKTGKHMARMASPLEDRVLAKLAERLSEADAAELLVCEDTPDTAAILAEVASARREMDALVDEWYAPGSTMTRRQFDRANAILTAQLATAEQRLELAGTVPDLEDVVNPGGDPAVALKVLKGLDVPRQRAVLSALADVVLQPLARRRGGRSPFNPDSITVTFRR